MTDFMKNSTKHISCGLDIVYTCDALDVRNHIQIGAFRYQMGSILGAALGERLHSLDYVVPVPNAGLYYAMGFSMETSIPYVQAVVKQDDHVRSLRLQNEEERKQEIQSNLCLIPSLLEEKRIALVDEAIFSGMTLKILVRRLRENGVREIHVCIPTSPCVHMCDRLPQRNLIARQKKPEELADYLQADSVTFMPDELFREQTKRFEGLCVKCFQ
ncbi:MAG: hypothetical protein LUC98_09710 [Lachnospiraceae bacterium]|nr:hypothetical protein [Lachnospiraceae bacterium]